MGKRLELGLVLVFAAAAAGCGTNSKEPSGVANQAYAMRFKLHGDVGKVVATRERSTGHMALKVLEGGHVLKEERQIMDIDNAYDETVLAMGKERPTKYERHYREAITNEGGQRRARSYAHDTVLFDLHESAWKVSVKSGKPLTPKDEKHLIEGAKQPSVEASLLPGKEVRVGDSWKGDVRIMAETLGHSQFDLAESHLDVKLAKVFERDGVRFGVLELKTLLAITEFFGLAYRPPARFEATGTVELAIDGKSTTGQIRMKVQLSGKGTRNQKVMIDLFTEYAYDADRSAER